MRSIADGESQFLFGVIELYQTKVNTKMTVAMERLAVIAAVTLPVTAIASVYGMNVIVQLRRTRSSSAIVLLVMLVMSSCCCAGRAGRAGGEAAQNGLFAAKSQPIDTAVSADPSAFWGV